jgi:hypothetical protein
MDIISTREVWMKNIRMRIPREGERESGIKPNGIQDDSERDSGTKANTDSALKPNTFRATPEWCSPSSRNQD